MASDQETPQAESVSSQEFSDQLRRVRLDLAAEALRFLRADIGTVEHFRDIAKVLSEVIQRDPEQLLAASPAAPPVAGGAHGEEPGSMRPIAGGSPATLQEICDFITCLLNALDKEKDVVLQIIKGILGF